MKSNLVLKGLSVIFALTAFGIKAQPKAVAAAAIGEKQTSLAPFPGALVGAWRNGDIATMDFYNTQTGEWQNKTGYGMFLTIQPNGEYRFGSVESVYLDGAEARYQVYQQGQVTIRDGQMVLQPTSGYTEVLENCASQAGANPQAGANDLQASAFAFEIVAEKNVPYRPTLVLTSETGEKIELAIDGL